MFNLTDDRKYGLAAIGAGLSQLATGQPVNIAGTQAGQMVQQRQMRARLEESGILQRFSPEQRAILAQMPPQAAMSIIAGEAFKAPAAPMQGKVVGDRLVNPVTGQVIADFSQPPAQPDRVRVVTGEEAAAIGLDPEKAYEVTEDAAGNLKNVSGIGGGDTNINMPSAVGTPIGTKGDVMIQDPTAPGGVRIIQAQGSQAEFERRQSIVDGAKEAIEAAENKEEVKELAGRAGMVVLEDIKRVTDKIENAPFWTTGAVGSVLSNIGGTQAADVKALTMTIRGNIGFDRLQQMRDASPTGGALGAINKTELDTLQSVLGSLEQSQSDEQLLYNLERLEAIYTDIMKKAGAYPNAAEFGFEGGAEPISDEDLFRQYGLE